MADRAGRRLADRETVDELVKLARREARARHIRASLETGWMAGIALSSRTTKISKARSEVTRATNRCRTRSSATSRRRSRRGRRSTVASWTRWRETTNEHRQAGHHRLRGSSTIFWPSDQSMPEERRRLYEALADAVRPTTLAQALDRAEEAMRDACRIARCDYPDFVMSELRGEIEYKANQ